VEILQTYLSLEIMTAMERAISHSTGAIPVFGGSPPLPALRHTESAGADQLSSPFLGIMTEMERPTLPSTIPPGVPGGSSRPQVLRLMESAGADQLFNL